MVDNVLNAVPQHSPFVCCLAVLAVMCSLAPAAEAQRVFPHPDRIRYDSNCFTIDGEDVFLYSGAFHYFRCPKPLWRDRFQTIKDAGFNCVETYVPWNWHERETPSGLDDFSKVDLTDLEDWLNLAEEFGFYIIIRPGPYICAEWDTGGFPQWLLTKKPADWKGLWWRSDEPTFLAWSKHWIKAVCPVVEPHQITRKAPGEPGIILFQVENEYDYMGNAGNAFSDDVKVRHVKALAKAALAGGIDVPLMTCWTRQVRGSTDPVLRQIFDTCNFYPRWNVEGELGEKIPKLRREQPDAPLMTTELQGGWFSDVGGKLSDEQDGVNAAQIQNLTLFAIQQGQTALNYYMLFGGTNLDNWGGRNMTTSYDYNAPIREWGGVGERYQRVRAIGAMLREHGDRLVRAEAVDCQVVVSQQDVSVAMRRTPDGSRYLFVRTSDHTHSREGTARVTVNTQGNSEEIVFDYTLEPFGSMVLYLPPGISDTAQGDWLPKPAPSIDRPTDLPPAVTITSARRRIDPGPSRWTSVPSGQRLAQVGVYDSGFVFYRPQSGGGDERPNLQVEFASQDDVVAQVGQTLAPCVDKAKGRGVFAVGGAKSALLLYENRGHAHYARDFEYPSGISSARFIFGTSPDGEPIDEWRMLEVDGTGNRPEVRPGFKDDDWTPVAVDKLEADQLEPERAAVFRAKLNLEDEDLKGGGLELRFGRIDDHGWVFVNGKQVGEVTDWSRSHAFDMTRNLRAGENVIAVVVQNKGGVGGLGRPTLARAAQAPVALEFGRPAGVEEQWWKPGFEDQGWETVHFGEAKPSRDDAALTWYRMTFSVQPPKPGVWVPWRLRLNATGNGFIYLNGHEIGRYWQIGPQYEFFLPECWLNFGPGAVNHLTVSLRPLDKGAAIQSAIVEPYQEYAEER